MDVKLSFSGFNLPLSTQHLEFFTNSVSSHSAFCSLTSGEPVLRVGPFVGSRFIVDWLRLRQAVWGKRVFVGVSEDGLGLNGIFRTVTMKVGVVILL